MEASLCPTPISQSRFTFSPSLGAKMLPHLLNIGLACFPFNVSFLSTLEGDSGGV